VVELRRTGVPPRRILRFLIDESVEPSLAEQLVSEVVAIENGITEGQFGYNVWFAYVNLHPLRGGMVVSLIMGLSAVVALGTSLLIGELLPPGQYSARGLAVPGVVAGLAVFYSLSRRMLRLKQSSRR